jgi:hypothetical protein
MRTTPVAPRRGRAPVDGFRRRRRRGGRRDSGVRARRWRVRGGWGCPMRSCGRNPHSREELQQNLSDDDSDSDQSSADLDQTAADLDHSASERDQRAANRDQLASDLDQLDSDHARMLGADAPTTPPPGRSGPRLSSSAAPLPKRAQTRRASTCRRAGRRQRPARGIPVAARRRARSRVGSRPTRHAASDREQA